MAALQDDPLRPDDADAYRKALRAARERSGLPVAFGGDVADGVLRLSQFVGVRTAGLRGLAVRAETGLGGQVLARRRPAAVADYRTAASITHDYDGPVLAEGITGVVAAPVVVAGRVRGVLYAATRDHAAPGARGADALVDA
ncbi:GAF domain-containing protein, partial [Streptacidiphilus monticola]